MRQSVQKAIISLMEVKQDVIGLYKHPTLGVFELVTKLNVANETIDSVFISNFGSINQQYGMPIGNGKIHMFPEGKNMNEMLNLPFEWRKFLTKFD